MSSSKRIAVIGANGQLGSEIVEVLSVSSNHDPVALTHSEVEVRDSESVDRALSKARADVVINTAALHNVDGCEMDPEQAFAVNAVGAQHVARAASRSGAHVVYVSTDYVFSGEADRPYLEYDYPRPLNVYGASKLAGEHLTLSASPRALVVRVSSLFGATAPRGKEANFIGSIIRRARSGEKVSVATDVVMSPTYARDAARLIAALGELETTGVIHGSNTGSCSWFELADFALSLAGVDAHLTGALVVEWPSVAAKPVFSPMATSRLEALGLQMRPWQEAVADYLQDVGHLTRDREGQE